MNLPDIIKALADRRLSVIAAATGVNRETLRRIRDGVTPNPGHVTVEKLQAYFGGQP
jgi:hypothetical protein